MKKTDVCGNLLVGVRKETYRTARRRRIEGGKIGETFWSRKVLRDLVNARGFHDRRTALAIGEAGGFFFVGIDAAERFAVGVTNGDEKMMMTAAAVFAEFRFFIADGLFG